MSDPTPDEGIADRSRQRPQPPLTRVAHRLPSVVALLTAVSLLLLIVTRQTEHLTAVAAFGASVFAGDAAVQVTVHVKRR
ncbi:hypothetical protein ACFXDH_10605 [Streptomyces sp. NPDC059467]|uniref:hypothetical protein n=1 Tax=Streptomyces sp. NPDC059467 TaxID=3346844 RepID=UPI003699FE9A